MKQHEKSKSWVWQIKNSVVSLEELKQKCTVNIDRDLTEVIKKYRFAVTPYYLSLADPNDADDPILRQVIPSALELINKLAVDEDPLQEERDSLAPGLIKRYPDRALLVLTNKCAVYCRHCTRKRIFENREGQCSSAEIDTILSHLRKNEDIKEVIISGGDPLTLPTKYIRNILRKLEAIEHIEVIRIGSRTPVVLPQRFDDELINVFSESRCLWLNTQFNHPNEITEEAAQACDRIIRAGVPIHNQTVLLKGVNDLPDTIKTLCRKLLSIKVKPYYLFQCDQVKGTEHFWTSVWTGMDIMEHMRCHVSGLAVPTYAVDIPGGAGKVVINPSYILSISPEKILLRNYKGVLVSYANPAGSSLFSPVPSLTTIDPAPFSHAVSQANDKME